MRRTSKISTFWTQNIQPNPFPAMIVPNFSLGKTASSMAIYVPMYSAEKNVNFVTKDKTPESKGGETLDLITPPPLLSGMTGSGLNELNETEMALLHPIKVL